MIGKRHVRELQPGIRQHRHPLHRQPALVWQRVDPQVAPQHGPCVMALGGRDQGGADPLGRPGDGVDDGEAGRAEGNREGAPVGQSHRPAERLGTARDQRRGSEISVTEYVGAVTAGGGKQSSASSHRSGMGGLSVRTPTAHRWRPPGRSSLRRPSRPRSRRRRIPAAATAPPPEPPPSAPPPEPPPMAPPPDSATQGRAADRRTAPRRSTPTPAPARTRPARGADRGRRPPATAPRAGAARAPGRQSFFRLMGSCMRSRSTGRPAITCSSTISFTSATVTPPYQTPSG